MGDKHAEQKGLAQQYTDEHRRATESDIVPADTVWVLNEQVRHKLDTLFIDDPYSVVSREGE